MKKYFWLHACVVCCCILSSLNAVAQTAQLTILPVFNGAKVTPKTWYVSKKGDSMQLTTCRFYLSNLAFEDEKGIQNRDSQTAHLIDIFDPETFNISTAFLKNKPAKKISFNIGIDSATNVAGALGGDLDPQKGMYWSWQSGYVNFKVEGISPRCKTRKGAFQFHIGGYMQPFSMVRSMQLAVSQKDTRALTLKIELSTFFENIQLAQQNSVMMPNKAAMTLADVLMQMFSIDGQ